ncbi:hypothetical protein QTP88_008540 [Uroleucon formosanum]
MREKGRKTLICGVSVSLFTSVRSNHFPISFPQFILYSPFTATTASAAAQPTADNQDQPTQCRWERPTFTCQICHITDDRSLKRPSPCPMAILVPRPITTIDCLSMTTSFSSSITTCASNPTPTYLLFDR